MPIAILASTPAPVRERLAELDELRAIPADDRPGAERALAEAGSALLHAPARELLTWARRVHALDPAVQVVLLVAEEDRAATERALLFSLGLGEVWLADPAELDAGLLARAAQVTQRRRSYQATHRRVQRGLERLGGPPQRSVHVTDAFLAALLRLLPDPVVSIDEEDRVMTWNPAAERVLGVAAAEAVGRPVAQLLGADDPSALAGVMQAARSAPQQLELRFRTPAGEERVAELALAPVEAEGVAVRSLLLHDITEQRRTQLELENQAAELEMQSAELELLNAEMTERTEELEAALQSRSRFYSAMSHELRTPVNAILGYTSLMLEEIYGPVLPRQHDALVRSVRASKHLLELINDVLDLAKIEAGRIDVEAEDTEFPQLLEELIDTVRPVAEEQGTELRLHAPPAPLRIRTDPRRVRQILLNLLSNAIKYGGGRPVEVRCQALDGGGVRIDVADQGAGISPDDLPRIFEEFVQVQGRSGSGTGLGLPISQRLAELLGGRLEVESRAGEGSVFRLLLPAALDADGAA